MRLFSSERPSFVYESNFAKLIYNLKLIRAARSYVAIFHVLCRLHCKIADQFN